MTYSRPQKAVPDGTANFRLPLDTLRKLDSYCAATDITRSQLIRRLITGFEPLKQITDNQQPNQNHLSYPGWFVNEQR
jgi:hypothetical protein